MRPWLRTLSFLFLLLFSFCAWSAHIVGGDFSYRHISGDTYELKMKMYRDCGGGGAPFENSLTVGIYSKETNGSIKTINVPRRTIYPIRFNTGCTSPQLRCVEVGIFTVQFTMPKTQFNNTDGYYIHWERCCRNNIIKNIIDPGATSMAFYMEIPSPYPNNGDFRLNNSPDFRRDPLNYLCVDEPFKYDFKIWDADGDELRLRAFTPLAGGYASQFNPQQATGAAPYQDVDWQNGYGPNFPNYMDGNPDLFVDDDSAFIYIVPREIGVYVISVLCDEYRDGVKIGEVRRELQLEVLSCPPRNKPVASSSLAAQGNRVNATINEEVCFNVLGSDGDAAEVLRMRVDTVGMYKILGNGATLSPSDVAGNSNISAQFCWTPTCPLDTANGTFIDFIIYDNSCPFTQDDTVRVYFNIIVPQNIVPQVLTTIPNNEVSITTGETYCFLIQGTDGNVNDPILVEVLPANGYDVFAAGATLSPNVLQGTGNVSGQFCWTPPCGLQVDSFILLDLIISDSACPEGSADTIQVKINIIPIPNLAPEVITEGINISTQNVVTAQLNRETCFYVFAEDLDVDIIDLYASNVNYDFLGNGARISLIDDYDNAKRIQFCWTPTCDNLTSKNDLLINFITRDNKCENEKFDTVQVRYDLVFPPNDNPAFIYPDSATYNLNAGYGRAIPVTGTDVDINDLLILSARQLYPASVPMRIEMATIEGQSSISSTLNVYPECGIQGSIAYPIELQLLSNSICNLYDTVTQVVNIVINPLEANTEPQVPTAFSPNNDGNNDVFKVYMASRNICPEDFKVKIYNRWGQVVFESLDPEFEWNGSDAGTGAYIYYIQIGKVKYSGFISLVR